jgi:pimeloyl-ACP methyl ester carboxylesterase
MPERVEINDVEMWFDRRGEGPPLVLLHGGLTDSRDFKDNLDRLTEDHRVFMPERRGHGHTADTARELTIEEMAVDMQAFAEVVVGEPADIVGYSVGAAIAIHMAVNRPDLVRKLVAISGALSRDGWLFRPVAGGAPPEPLRQAYGEVSPDGTEHFGIVVDKVAAAAEAQRYDLERLSALTAPTLLIAGDDDIVDLDHLIAVYRSIPNAALSIVANASHLLLHEHPDHVTGLVGMFLHGTWRATLMPVRRSRQ